MIRFRAIAPSEGGGGEGGGAAEPTFGDYNPFFMADGLFDTAIDLSGDTALQSMSVIAWNDSNEVVETINYDGCTGLKHVYLEAMNALESLTAVGCTALQSFSIFDTNGLLSLDLSGCPALVNLGFDGGPMTTLNLDGAAALESVMLAYMTSLTTFDMSDAPLLTSLDISGLSALVAVTMTGCALPEALVDSILASLVTNGASDGVVNLSGGTSAPPSSTGLDSKAALELLGWTVTVNS